MVKRGAVLFGSALAMVLGCGDDGSTTGAGGSGGAGTTGSTSVTSTSGLPTTSSVTGPGSTGSGGDPAGTGGGSSSGGGTAEGGGGTGGTGGNGSGGNQTFESPCGDICHEDAGCDAAPVDPSDACVECVQGEAAQGSDSECAFEAATGPCCQDSQACGDFITCVITGGTPESCAAGNEEGATQASLCILESCGDCPDAGGGEGGGGGTGGGGTGGGGTGGGGTFDSPCGEVCSSDAGCEETPPAPTGECAACVQAEAEQGAGSACVIDGATGPCCQDDPACADYISCLQGGGTLAQCAQDNPAGAQQAQVCVLESCGECGGDGAGGGGQAAAPCEAACADDPGCDENPSAPSGPCADCIQAEQDAQSGCVIQGAVSPCCQGNAECVAFVECVQGGTEPLICGILNFDGATRAQECIRESCGACGDPQ